MKMFGQQLLLGWIGFMLQWDGLGWVDEYRPTTNSGMVGRQKGHLECKNGCCFIL